MALPLRASGQSTETLVNLFSGLLNYLSGDSKKLKSIMTAIPPPQGLNEDDYDAIEAAVTETVRGRWFLAEFARRNRMVEMRQLLDAMGRLEAVAAPNQLPQGSDPSIRLMIQRIKEIAARLGSIAADMRESGVSERFAEAIELEGRAVAGMMRAGTPRASGQIGEATQVTTAIAPTERLASPEAPQLRAQPWNGSSAPPKDARLALLSELDGRPLGEKLRLFT
jgi:hypothetical protein